MLTFRQKIFISYAGVFLVVIAFLYPFITGWAHRIIFRSMEARATEIISLIKDAPNNEVLINRLKNQKSNLFFRTSIIANNHHVLYDSHTKRLLGSAFSQNYVVNHPEVLQAFKNGIGYHEEYSNLLKQHYSYLAKAFDFHGHTYVLRTAFPHQYVLEIKRDFKIGFLALATIVLVMFSLMTWYAIHYLTTPIQRIINAVKSYEQDGQTMLPVIDVSQLNPNDDFSKLGSTLNSLSVKIQKQIQMLTDERDEKALILESLVEGVIAVDVEMNIDYANEMSLKLLGRLNEKLIDKNFSFLAQDQCETLLKKCQEEKNPASSTLEVERGSQRIFLDAIAAPKKNKTGAILVLQDKTTHYKLLEMRRDFIANASHELKTPITVIRGFAEALHDNTSISEEMHELMTSKIINSCIRMTALIKDLLILADIENIPFSRLVYSELYSLIDSCKAVLMEAFPDAQISIERKNERVGLVADPELLKLAIINLMENAIKYSESPAQIRIILSETEKDVVIQVIDQGIGIPLLEQEHIFDRFYTVDKAHSKKMGGSGLGLSIVKTIIEKHFGSISLQSEVKKGSTFTITLPKYHF